MNAEHAQTTNPRRFLIAVTDAGGSVPPVLSVAGALVRRGHDVRVIVDPVVQPEVEAVGARFVSWTRGPHRSVRAIETEPAPDWEANTPAASFAAVRDNVMAGPSADVCADVLAELRREPADAMAFEMLASFGSQIAAEAAGVPCAMLGSTIDPTPVAGKPPFGPGLSPARGRLGRLRDRAFSAMGKRLWDKALPALNAARAGQGLEPIEDAFDTMRKCDRVVLLSPRAFEFPYEPWANVVHAGPRLEDPVWAEGQQWEPPAGDGPLVLVGLSSTFQDQAEALRHIAAALGELPVRGLITTGLLVDPSEIPAPANVTVVNFAPHGEVLEHASAVVTHAGHGTVMKALAHGVPMVCLPMGRDQNDVAQRVAVAGAGIRLKPSASVGKIAAAVTSVLDDAGYRAGAMRLQEAIAEDLETDRAVEELEALAATRDSDRPATFLATSA